jgi:hypothetical protein
MSKQFHHAGVSFEYPDNWLLEPEDHDDGWGLSLYSPGTAFVTIRCHRSMPTIEELAETALAAMRAEYPDLEAEPRVESLAGQMALGHDMQFMSLDLTNIAWTRSLYTDAGTLLILGQTSDADPGGYEPVLRGILTSLRLEEPATEGEPEGQ